MSRLSKKPGAPMGSGICLIVYGGLGFLCVTCSGLALVVDMDDMGIQAILDEEAPGNRIIQAVCSGIGIVTSLTLVACGIGVLLVKPLARYVAYGALALDLLTTLTMTLYSALVLFPIHDRVLGEEAGNNLPGEFPFEKILSSSLWGGLLLNLLFTLTFCVINLYLLSCASTRAAFAAAESEPEEDERWRKEDDEDDYGETPRRPQLPPDTGITGRSG